MYAELERKICSVCKKPKEKKEFRANRSNSKDGLRSNCRECDRKAEKLSRQNNPLKYDLKEHKRTLRRFYGMTIDQYNKMFEEQAGCCGICGTHQMHLKRRLAVDHCHTTNVIRGLLCDNCNPMLGYAKDEIVRLQNAVKYLQKFKK